MNKNDNFDDPDTGFGFLGSIGPKAAFFIVLIALSFMIGLVWKLYTGGNNNNTEVPVIRADVDGYKVEPDDRGGMEIKFQDSTLFDSDDPDAKVENLLADEDKEAPMPRSQLFAGLNTDNNEIQDIEIQEVDNVEEDPVIEPAEKTEQPVAKLTQNEVVVAEESQAVIVTEAQKNLSETTPAAELMKEPTPKLILEMPEITAEEKPVVVEKQPVIAAPEPRTAIAGDYYVQLASVKSKTAAEAEWDKFVTKYSPLLDGASHRVETADLGAKGTFYRIQAGSMSKSQADEVCNGIKSKGGSCLVKKK